MLDIDFLLWTWRLLGLASTLLAFVIVQCQKKAKTKKQKTMVGPKTKHSNQKRKGKKSPKRPRSQPPAARPQREQQQEAAASSSPAKPPVGASPAAAAIRMGVGPAASQDVAPPSVAAASEMPPPPDDPLEAFQSAEVPDEESPKTDLASRSSEELPEKTGQAKGPSLKRQTKTRKTLKRKPEKQAEGGRGEQPTQGTIRTRMAPRVDATLKKMMAGDPSKKYEATQQQSQTRRANTEKKLRAITAHSPEDAPKEKEPSEKEKTLQSLTARSDDFEAPGKEPSDKEKQSEKEKTSEKEKHSEKEKNSEKDETEEKTKDKEE